MPLASHHGSVGLLAGAFLTAVLIPSAARADAIDPLRGFCTATTTCSSSTQIVATTNPPTFGFLIDPGSTTKSTPEFLLELLVPDQYITAPDAITGTHTGNITVSGSLVSSIAWTGVQMLDAYLGIHGSPTNPLNGLNIGLTTGGNTSDGFFVYQYDFGSASLNNHASGNPNPTFSIASALPLGTTILAFAECGNATGEISCPGGRNSNIRFIATANSESLVETTPPTRVPEPSSLALVGSALFGLGWVAQKRKRK